MGSGEVIGLRMMTGDKVGVPLSQTALTWAWTVWSDRGSWRYLGWDRSEKL